MLWYLLYPFRGTRDPPLPSSESLIRRAFYRHGALTARYWLAVMLAAVATGVILSYPAVFMSDFPPGGINGLPHHVWTGSASFESRTEKQPDLEMRQVWLRGGYMKALNTSVLLEAFNLQRELLSVHTSSEVDSPSAFRHRNDWAVHSPTIFWRNSVDLFNSDDDPLLTINEFNHDATFSHLDLRSMSVFAGKSFRKNRLVAADALVLTLLSRHNSSIGAIWDASLKSISTHEDQLPWTVQNSANTTNHDSIYEYKFQPLSLNQYWALIGAYLCMGIYTVASLRRLKAFKSRFGVIVTAITQMTTSILASFTICGLLRINLAQIPQEAYPFVVLSIGLENIFRLINAVLAYPPEMATTQRIANGLGDAGIASVASAAQNLAILWVLSHLVSPGVAAFCAFAAIALLFDFFFLITFFVAVLNVDIRRLELQDSLSRQSRPRIIAKRKKTTERQSWVDALIQGKVPFSTRMAGSAITVTFVMLLNWHFSDNNISVLGISPWSTPSTKQYFPTLGSDRAPTAPLNRTLTLASWMRPQNASTAAAQFMHVVKPGIQSFTARVFDPVVIVVGGADRTGIPPPEDTWLIAIRELAINHFYPFALAVVFVVAFVTVLMNFLLWDARAEAEEIDLVLDEGPLSCKTVETSHKLDIVHLANAACGKVLSTGLDRSLSLATKDRTTKKYTKLNLELSNSPDTSDISVHWPIDTCIVDGSTGHLAALCRDSTILLGKAHEGTFSRAVKTNLEGWTQSPVLFEFITRPLRTASECVLLILSRDGTLLELGLAVETPTLTSIATGHQGIVAATQMIPSSVTSGALVTSIPPMENIGPQLVFLNHLGSLHQYYWHPHSRTWTPLSLRPTIDRPSIPLPLLRDSWIHPVPTLNIYLLCTPDDLQIIDAHTLRSCSTLRLSSARRSTIRVLHSDPVQCRQCANFATSVFCLAYTSLLDNSLVHTSYTNPYAPPNSSSKIPICIAGAGRRCTSLLHAIGSETRLPSPGKWESTSRLCLAGVRRTASPTTLTPPQSTPVHLEPESPLRRRRRQSAAEQPDKEGDEWEAYLYSHTGSYHAIPVPSLDINGDGQVQGQGQLFAHTLGPVAKLGSNTVGVALGNAVVVVDVNENPDAPDEEGGRRTSWTPEDGGGGVWAGLRRSGSRGKGRGGAGGVGRMTRRLGG
ncbi:hypothetical protein K461DRAFT_275719 [Myriangium duriaei CBS 260.36]|uniref:SSD domain-containing protein n=1 Tax=Myriangium duriaei CBS 260.36 TaxID=1168546 RepID=A0A9P4J6Z0_9PEZI|nr:hypothetical protein K461DRAFT_275719 [Myriangium duriaei CBS 260.36]